MKTINKQNISDYLQNTCSIKDPQELFNTQTSYQSRFNIINKVYHHFTNHYIDSESGVLITENDSTAQIKTYYYEYRDFNHLTSLEELTKELNATQKVITSIQNFNKHIIQQRSKTQSRLSEISKDDVIQHYELER